MTADLGRNPQPMYQSLLRDSDAVRIDGVGVLACSREAVDDVLRHPEIFSSNTVGGRPQDTAAADPAADRPARPPEVPQDPRPALRAAARCSVLDEPIAQLVNDLIDTLDRRRRDRLHRAVLDPVPLTGVPDAVRAPDRRAASVPGDEGRHHPAPPRRRPAGRPSRYRSPTSRRRPTRSTSTSRACSTSGPRRPATTS